MTLFQILQHHYINSTNLQSRIYIANTEFFSPPCLEVSTYVFGQDRIITEGHYMPLPDLCKQP